MSDDCEQDRKAAIYGKRPRDRRRAPYDFNNQPVTIPQLKEGLRQLQMGDPSISVVIQGGDNVDYQIMISVLDVLQQLSITNVGLATQAPGGT